MSEEKSRRMEVFALIATPEQLKKFASDMAKIGWKLTYRGSSGSWLGEPVFEVKTDGTEKKNDR